MWRFNIYRIALQFQVLPEQVEEMDFGWYEDILLFGVTEDIAAKATEK